jgi:hypothetical protein
VVQVITPSLKLWPQASANFRTPLKSPAFPVALALTSIPTNAPLLNHKVNLVLIFVSVVIQSVALTAPRRLFKHLSENKCFQQRSEDRTVFRNPIGAWPAAKKTGISTGTEGIAMRLLLDEHISPTLNVAT